MNKKLKYFGTDGIRGHVGVSPITVDFMLKIGWAIGIICKKQKGKKVLIGKDPRISGYMIESALQAGLSSAGMKIFLVGPMPTSAIAYLTRTFRVDIGIVISASHNPYQDNGIKLFSSKGFKFPEKFELEIENMMNNTITTANPTDLGKALRIEDAAGRYIEFCKSAIPHHTHLDNLKLVVDCANGATYHIAPFVFSELGAHVTPIHISPNGFNINHECGSNHPSVIQRHVLKTNADVGIAFDGDGDRVILIDHQGEVLDGDEILYIIAKGLVATTHYSSGVIGTIMSNRGLEIAINELNLSFEKVNVGSQHIIEGLLKNKWLLGGEPSGHITYLRMNTTDDGIIAALLVLQTMHMTGKSLHDLKKGLRKFPQQLQNIPYSNNPIDLKNKEITNFIKQSEKKLGKYGRIIIRNSGTEHVIRLMVEGENQSLVSTISEELNFFINKQIN